MKPTQEAWELGLTRERCAAYLGVTTTTLDKLDVPQPKRLTGAVGPNLYRYDRHEIDRWMASRPRRDGSVPTPDNDPDTWGDPD